MLVIQRVVVTLSFCSVMTAYSHRPHKDTEDLQEFTEPDCTDMEGIKPFFEGHDRFVCLRYFISEASASLFGFAVVIFSFQYKRMKLELPR